MPAQASELYDDGAMTVRWDNTLRYSMAVRLSPRDPAVADDANDDDGDRNFAPGVVSNRLDLVSVLDISGGDMGLHASAVAWYDTVYHARTDNHSPSTYNAFSVTNAQFPRPTRNLHGQYANLEEANGYANVDLAGMPVSLRLGRQTLLWGESLFFAENSIAGAQSPVDAIRDVSAPGTYSNQVFLPVGQISFQLQPRPDLSISAYYQFEWRKDRQPAVGSYFSYHDGFDAGGERLIVAPGEYLYRIKDLHPPSQGQFGVSLRATIGEVDLGLYAIRFHAKEPAVWTWWGRSPDPSIGKVGEYQLFYPSGIELYGASFSTYAGDSAVAGEISLRRRMPLVSLTPASGYWTPDPGEASFGGTARGDTLHGQVSSIMQFERSRLWDGAELSVEAAANYRLNITTNANVFDTTRNRFALSFRGLFEPHYFQVLPNLDISLPVSLGYNAVGRSSIDDAQYAGSGDLEAGLAATYRSVWRARLTVTTYFGSAERQPFSDRDFAMLSFERTL